jgi:hypothetical protein
MFRFHSFSSCDTLLTAIGAICTNVDTHGNGNTTEAGELEGSFFCYCIALLLPRRQGHKFDHPKA